MVSDHTADCEAYQKWAGKHADAGLREGEPGASGQREGQQLTQRGGPADWSTIHEQMAQQCLASAKQELGRHQGTELDHCYMGMQLGAHMKMQDELKVLREHVSGDLRQQIDKSLEGVQGHLKEARQIVEQQKDSPSERVSRKPDSKQKE